MSMMQGKDTNGQIQTIRTTSSGVLYMSSNTDTIGSDMEGIGKTSVGISATQVVFTGNTKSIIITSDLNNTGTLYIGKSNVTASGANAFTLLSSGDSITIDYNDTDDPIYIVSDTISQNFWGGALLNVN